MQTTYRAPLSVAGLLIISALSLGMTTPFALQDPPTGVGHCPPGDPVTTNSCGPLSSVSFTWSQRDPGTCDDNGNITSCRFIGNAAAVAPSVSQDPWWVCLVDNTDEVSDACKDSAKKIPLDGNGDPIAVNLDIRYTDIACGQPRTLRFHFFRRDNNGLPVTPCKIVATLNCGGCTFSGGGGGGSGGQ